MKERIERFKAWMEGQGIDVSIILKPQDVAYLSGWAPVCSGIVVFRKGPSVEVCIWLDAPDGKRNHVPLRMAGYRFPESSMAEKVVELINQRLTAPRIIGIEKDFMTLRFWETIQKAFPGASFVPVTRALDDMRAVKTAEEIRYLKKATAMAEAGMKAALASVRPGVTEIDIASEAEYAMRKAGSEGVAFGTLVASGPRALLAHPYASSRKIGKRDVVVIDLGARYKGYSSDLCRTAFTGEPSRRQKEFLKILLQAQQAAFRAARPGVKTEVLYEEARKVLAGYGYARYLPDDIGYGSGLRQSEFFPVVLKGGQDVLQSGMVIALFQTTAYLRELGGIRVEDQIVVGEGGYRRLSALPQPVYD